MLAVVSSLLIGITLLLAIPTLIIFFEVFAALVLPARIVSATRIKRSNGRVAVLVPAHNEGTGLLLTLSDIRAQLRQGDRLVVVADNCTDNTAAVAVSAGAEITVRTDLIKIGKGYALDWGIKHIAADPPDIVIVIDADCRVADGTIAHLANACEDRRRPIQSLNLMTASVGSGINHQVAEFAWRMKNWVRPLGLSALGLPCQLMGTGMAIPWNLFRTAGLASGLIVEDLKFGLDLASAGHYPQFFPQAVVSSTFPNSAEGAKAQRQRWEQGQIGLICHEALPLMFTAVKRKDIRLLALVLDLMVPPLSLFVFILGATASANLFIVLLDSSYNGLLISAICLGMFMVVIVSAWAKYGRDILPLKSLGQIVVYLSGKLRTYFGVMLGRRISLWTRADRS